MIISFSGFPGKQKAKYNYMRTLNKIDAYKLFLLDDFGYKKRGSYYLGEDGDWFLPQQIGELVTAIREKYNIEHVVTIGSSKGGTAALYYSIKLHADFCVIGAPQFYLGDYLNTEKHADILEGIMGNKNAETIAQLNSVMIDCIQMCGSNKPEVYIHYSPCEHTYKEHIADMLAMLKKHGFCVWENSNYEYANHADVAKYFPAYMISVLKNQTREEQ